MDIHKANEDHVVTALAALLIKKELITEEEFHNAVKESMEVTEEKKK